MPVVSTIMYAHDMLACNDFSWKNLGLHAAIDVGTTGKGGLVLGAAGGPLKRGLLKQTEKQAIEKGTIKGVKQYSEPIGPISRDMRPYSRNFKGEPKISTRKGFQKHHGVQDAAVKDLPGYDKRDAPTIHLEGSGHQTDLEHGIVTNMQKKLVEYRGTLAGELEFAEKTLKVIGIDDITIREYMKKVNKYFYEDLGLNPATKTRIPGRN